MRKVRKDTTPHSDMKSIQGNMLTRADEEGEFVSDLLTWGKFTGVGSTVIGSTYSTALCVVKMFALK